MADRAPLLAIVVARIPDDRILLRALLRIHHIQVEAETEGAAQAARLVRERNFTHMVVDSELADGTVPELVAEARSIRADLRVVVLTRPNERAPDLPNIPGPPIAYLARPFRFSQFAEALGVRPLSNGSS